MRIKLTILLLPVYFFCFSQNNIAYLGASELSSPKGNSPETNSNTSKFTISGGLIMVDAFVDGELGQYILDTGAPGLIINSKEKNGKSVLASSVNSSIKVGEVLVETFQWGPVEKKNVASYSLDISHMSRGDNGSPDGLIGYQILAKNAVLVDFEKTEISVLSKRDLKQKIKSSENVVTIPFITEGYLPVIKLKIKGRNYRFILDTGAEKNLLNKDLFKKSNPQNVKYELMQGLDSGIRKVAVGEVENLKSKDYEIEKMEFLSSDLSGLNSGGLGYEISGLLGLPFFQNKTFAIDYRKNELHIWE